MQAGETSRFDCESCSTEFEVTYEPKAAVLKPEDVADIPAAAVAHCPFCGGGDVTPV